MKLLEFLEDPFSKKAIHPAYGASCLHMRPAPEYASGEVVLASVYRNVGFGKTIESQVPANGRKLKKRIERGRRGANGIGIGVDSWRSILESCLRSPKQPNQSAKRFLQLCPLVPDAALYSSSARLSTNSWNPGQMVERIIDHGCEDPGAAAHVWRSLHEALSANDTSIEDPWALAVQTEFTSWRDGQIEWQEQMFEASDSVCRWRSGGGTSPAGSFVRDLKEVLELKKHLTRRQWISMLESLLRLASASHALWLCKANAKAFKLLRSAVTGGALLSIDELRNEHLAAGITGFWSYGQRAAETIRDHARDFVFARIGLNLLLSYIDDLHWMPDAELHIAVDSPQSLMRLATMLQNRRAEFPRAEFEDKLHGIADSQPRLFAAKKGIGSNVAEFLRHCLGQRQTSEEGMKSYDQGYWLRKRGHYPSSPWIVSAGPVAVLLIAYCCARRRVGPTTVDDLCDHICEYGLSIRAADVLQSDLGATLRHLGLTIDSPDAEGGMLVRNPFHVEGQD